MPFEVSDLDAYCLDMEQNDCRRNLCECDREMAYEIVAKQDNWKRQLHERFGFDRETYCSGIGHQSHKDVEWQFSAIHEMPGFERQDFGQNRNDSGISCSQFPLHSEALIFWWMLIFQIFSYIGRY